MRWPRLKATLHERGYDSPALYTSLGALAFGLPVLSTWAALGYGHDQGIWLLIALYAAMPFVLHVVARSLPVRNARRPGGARCASRTGRSVTCCARSRCRSGSWAS